MSYIYHPHTPTLYKNRKKPYYINDSINGILENKVKRGISLKFCTLMYLKEKLVH